MTYDLLMPFIPGTFSDKSRLEFNAFAVAKNLLGIKNMTLGRLNLLSSFALVLALSSAAQAQLVSVDFGRPSPTACCSPSTLYVGQAAAPDAAGGGTWNEITPLRATTVSGLVDSTNAATSVGICIGSGFSFDSLRHNDPVDQEVSAAGGFSNLFRDYFFSSASGSSNDLVTSAIFGLEPGNAYDLYFYGQGDNFTDTNDSGGQNVGIRIGNDVRHTSHDGVNGGDGLLVEDIEYVVFRGIVADSLGEIHFDQFNPGGGLHATDTSFHDSSLLAAGDPLAVDADGNASRFHAINGIQIVGDFPTVPGPVRLGDVNIDCAVDFLDITAFIAVLSSRTFQAEADIDGNGAVEFLDIFPFIEILSGQGTGAGLSSP